MPSRANSNEYLQSLIAAQAEVMRCGHDQQRIMDVVMERAAQLTSATAVFEVREGEQMVYRAASRSILSALGMRLDVHNSLSGRAVLEGRIMQCADSDHDPRVDREACRRVSARSMLCVPLFKDGVATGVLKVYAPAPNHFDAQDLATVQLLVGFLALATETAVAEQVVASSELRFRSLAERASDAIVSADERGLVTFWNASAGALFGYTESEIIGRPFTVLMPTRYTLSQEMARGRFDPNRLEHVFGKPLELTGRHKDGSEFPVEISSSASLVGRDRFFTSIIRDISERKRMEAVVLTLARTDHLTGLLNRRAGEEALQQELAHAHRYERGLSVLMIDIDHFKRINDTVGHAAGDAVIKNVSGLIAVRIRGCDVAIRWGGEEFLVLLPETGSVGAKGLAESLRALIEGTEFAGLPRVTVSIGAATFAPREEAAAAIARADAKLYEAKRDGRNRVRI